MSSNIDRTIRKVRQYLRLKLAGHFGLAKATVRDGEKIRQNRALFSARFIRGSGIEIGGLARPLAIPTEARVKYVDRMPAEELAQTYKDHIDQASAVVPDIVDNAETLVNIDDNSQDFVIVNHVVEHLENPLSFFKNAARVLKSGGIIFMSLPNKDHSFDQKRKITPFQHLIDDFENGPKASRREHYEDIVRNVLVGHNFALIGVQNSTLTNEEVAIKADHLFNENVDIHFHVWDIPAMVEMALALSTRLGLPLSLVAMLESASEGVFIFEKR